LSLNNCNNESVGAKKQKWTNKFKVRFLNKIYFTNKLVIQGKEMSNII